MIEIVRNFWEYRFFRFILVGIINTIFGYGLFALLIYFKLHYTIAVLLSTIIGVIFNFKTIGLIVFNNNNNKLIFKFFLVYFVTYWINVFLIYILKFFLNNLYLIGFIALLPVSVISFILNRFFIFNGKNK